MACRDSGSTIRSCSSPGRIGNAAYSQLQIDVLGSVIDTLHVARTLQLDVHEAADGLTRKLLEKLEEVWRRPDEGIWEVRSEPQHFVHGKLMSWVAFDRAVAMAERYGLDGPVDRWRRMRGEIGEEILDKGFSTRRNAFIQAYGAEALDASVLQMPILGFIAADDPRMV